MTYIHFLNLCFVLNLIRLTPHKNGKIRKQNSSFLQLQRLQQRSINWWRQTNLEAKVNGRICLSFFSFAEAECQRSSVVDGNFIHGLYWRWGAPTSHCLETFFQGLSHPAKKHQCAALPKLIIGTQSEGFSLLLLPPHCYYYAGFPSVNPAPLSAPFHIQQEV